MLTNLPNTTAECGHRCQCSSGEGYTYGPFKTPGKPLNAGYCEFYCVGTVEYQPDAYCGTTDVFIGNDPVTLGYKCTRCPTGETFSIVF